MKTVINLFAAIVLGIGIGVASFAIYHRFQPNTATDTTVAPTPTPTSTPTPTPSATPLVTVSTPLANGLVTSPLSVKGIAPSAWFSAAGAFPIQILDAVGTVIGHATAVATADWNGFGPVGFKASVPFIKSSTTTGRLLIEKDNTSGTAADDASFAVAVRFK